jgi:hypothetical protein
MRVRGDIRARFEVKSVAADTGAFEGYGAVFDVVDTYRDVILPGAFAETLAEHTRRGTAPRMLWFHDPGKAIGTWSEFREDERGLYCAGQLDLEHPDGQKAYGTLRGDGAMDLSIGYTAMLFEVDRSAELRRLKTIWLDEVSLAPRGHGVNPAAVVTDFKARVAGIQTIRDFEDFLREAGFSRDRAKAIASRGFKASADPRDEDGRAYVLAGIRRLQQILQS